jgi:predicted dinucleotide-utilizing enzyme
MKVVITSSSDIIKFFKNDNLINEIPFPFHTVHFVSDDNVNDFVKRKLKSGFQCVILSADQFAYNELVTKILSVK